MSNASAASSSCVWPPNDDEEDQGSSIGWEVLAPSDQEEEDAHTTKRRLPSAAKRQDSLNHGSNSGSYDYHTKPPMQKNNTIVTSRRLNAHEVREIRRRKLSAGSRAMRPQSGTRSKTTTSTRRRQARGHGNGTAAAAGKPPPARVRLHHVLDQRGVGTRHMHTQHQHLAREAVTAAAAVGTVTGVTDNILPQASKCYTDHRGSSSSNVLDRHGDDNHNGRDEETTEEEGIVASTAAAAARHSADEEDGDGAAFVRDDDDDDDTCDREFDRLSRRPAPRHPRSAALLITTASNQSAAARAMASHVASGIVHASSLSSAMRKTRPPRPASALPASTATIATTSTPTDVDTTASNNKLKVAYAGTEFDLHATRTEKQVQRQEQAQRIGQRRRRVVVLMESDAEEQEENDKDRQSKRREYDPQTNIESEQMMHWRETHAAAATAADSGLAEDQGEEDQMHASAGVTGERTRRNVRPSTAMPRTAATPIINFDDDEQLEDIARERVLRRLLPRNRPSSHHPRSRTKRRRSRRRTTMRCLRPATSLRTARRRLVKRELLRDARIAAHEQFIAMRANAATGPLQTASYSRKLQGIMGGSAHSFNARVGTSVVAFGRSPYDVAPREPLKPPPLGRPKTARLCRTTTGSGGAMARGSLASATVASGRRGMRLRDGYPAPMLSVAGQSMHPAQAFCLALPVVSLDALIQATRVQNGTVASYRDPPVSEVVYGHQQPIYGAYIPSYPTTAANIGATAHAPIRRRRRPNSASATGRRVPHRRRRRSPLKVKHRRGRSSKTPISFVQQSVLDDTLAGTNDSEQQEHALSSGRKVAEYLLRESSGSYATALGSYDDDDDVTERALLLEMQSQHDAATRICAIGRGFLARKALQRKRIAAGHITRVGRGFLARKHMRERRMLQHERQKRHDPALSISHGHDGDITEDDFEQDLSLAKMTRQRKLQDLGQSGHDVPTVCEMNDAVIGDGSDLDDAAALYATAGAGIDEHTAATRISALSRGFLLRKSLKKQHEAASRISAAGRGFLTRKQARREKDAAAHITRLGKGFLARKKLKQQKDAATQISRLGRGFLARKRLQQQKDAATQITRLGKGFLARKELKRKKEAATKITSLGRGFLTRKRAAGLRKVDTSDEGASAVLQSGNGTGRLKQDVKEVLALDPSGDGLNDEVKQEKKALSMLSRMARRRIASLRTKEQERQEARLPSRSDVGLSAREVYAAATRIGALGRGYVTRRAIKAKNDAASRIGAAGKGFLARKRIKKEKHAATHITRLGKGYLARKKTEAAERSCYAHYPRWQRISCP